MISLPATVRIFVAVVPIDFRNGFDGLAQLTRDLIKQDPLSGHLFVFSNLRRDRVMILYWDRDGLAVWMKRLEQGTFRWPSPEAQQVEWSTAELAAVLGGIDLKGSRRRPRFSLEK